MNIHIKDNRDSMEFIPNPLLEKQNNNSPFFICTQCGECCHIREKKDVTETEENAYMHFMYKEFGIIYLASLANITINVWPEEKEALEKEARKQGVLINIKPKRAVYNAKTNELIILDYFIDHDICPFFDKKTKQCGVYENRPLICRSYPLLTTKTFGKCKYKKLDYNAYGSEKIAAEKLEFRTQKLKDILKNMITNREITIKNMTYTELQNILNNSAMKEMRI